MTKDAAIPTVTTLPAIFEGLGQAAVEADLAPLDEIYLGAFQAWLRRSAPRAILEYHRGHCLSRPLARIRTLR